MLACIIIYATTVGATAEIRAHEYAHCNGWQHPPGWASSEHAYRPPRKFLRAYPGEVIEQPVRAAEARERCGGELGCQKFTR